MLLNTGCVSGGWELTRDYSKWLNSKKVALRVVLYILTMPVFFVTIMIDTLVNNTIDFWNGTVSESTQAFHKDGKSFYVQHEILQETGLKRSTIEIKDSNQKLLQTVVLSETINHDIQLFVDGVLRTEVKNIEQAFPLITTYDEAGKQIEQKNVFIENTNLSQRVTQN